jgi:hypothetical protein
VAEVISKGVEVVELAVFVALRVKMRVEIDVVKAMTAGDASEGSSVTSGGGVV